MAERLARQNGRKGEQQATLRSDLPLLHDCGRRDGARVNSPWSLHNLDAGLCDYVLGRAMSTERTRAEALEVMIAALASGHAREFHVGIVGYFVDGVPYAADSLAVSREQTPNLVATHDGFACDEFFPPDTLEPADRPRGVFTSPTGVEITLVRIEVKNRDIWGIAEFVNGEQRRLFLDIDVLDRKQAFDEERTTWLARGDRPL